MYLETVTLGMNSHSVLKLIYISTSQSPVHAKQHFTQGKFAQLNFRRLYKKSGPASAAKAAGIALWLRLCCRPWVLGATDGSVKDLFQMCCWACMLDSGVSVVQPFLSESR